MRGATDVQVRDTHTKVKKKTNVRTKAGAAAGDAVELSHVLSLASDPGMCDAALGRLSKGGAPCEAAKDLHVLASAAQVSAR